MKYIITERQLKRLVSESLIKTDVGKGTWYILLNKARESWKDALDNNVKIPNEYYNYITKIMMSIGRVKDEIETDVAKGSLSQSTLDKFNKNMIATIESLKKDEKLMGSLSMIPKSKRALAKSMVGKGIIKNSVDKSVNLTGKSFFIDGMVSKLKSDFNLRSPTTQNYIKVLTEMGNAVSNNQSLKNYLLNTIMGLL
jgi:hypothetical protein